MLYAVRKWSELFSRNELLNIHQNLEFSFRDIFQTHGVDITRNILLKFFTFKIALRIAVEYKLY